MKLEGDTQSPSLRDFLLSARSFTSDFDVVLAEAAVQLYRETQYRDLISFEEDIAKIAAVVLVISESAGALAELGAFASSREIRPALSVISNQTFSEDESFVRRGPIERIIKDDESRVAFFPWKKNGDIVKSSADKIYADVKDFLKERVSATSKTALYSTLGPAQNFYLLTWIIYISTVISSGSLIRITRSINPDIAESEIRDMLYCMRVAKWIDNVRYSHKLYYYTTFSGDPFQYAFRPTATVRDSIRRRAAVNQELRKIEQAPSHVWEVATKARAGA